MQKRRKTPLLKEELVNLSVPATHIQVHQTDGGAAKRRQEESDLVAKWNPTCNG
jgi:hypothetical protein